MINLSGISMFLIIHRVGMIARFETYLREHGGGHWLALLQSERQDLLCQCCAIDPSFAVGY